MSNDKKGSKYVIPSNEEIKQSIKESVKSKASQKRTTNTNTNTSTTKPAEKPTTTTTKKTAPPADTSKAKKSTLWNKAWNTTKFLSKGAIPAGIDKALDRMNKTSSLYYDPTTGKYIDTADMDPIWQKNLANNSNAYNFPYTIFKWPAKIGESINDIAEINDPVTRERVSTGVDIGSYFIPYYGVGKGIYDIGNKVSNTIWDTNRDMDMLKDLRYGDLGYSNKWLLDNDTGSWLDEPAAFVESLGEGIKTASANDWFHDLTGWGRRTGFSEQSDVYKLGQQTTIKMMQKMLEDTGNFDPANAKSRVTLNQFNMMNQLLKNSDAYWQFQSIKNSQDMNDADFSAYLEAAGIDENTYKGMEYAAKQLYNLGDNQERNGLRYDPKSNFSTNTPMIQYMYARKQKPIKDDPLAGLVGGSHVLDGYTKVGDNFVDIKTGENLVPEVGEPVNQNAPTQEATTSMDTATTGTTTTTTTTNDTKKNAVNTVKDTPNYVKAGFYEFPEEYTRRTGYNFANNPYNIWK